MVAGTCGTSATFQDLLGRVGKALVGEILNTEGKGGRLSCVLGRRTSQREGVRGWRW